MSTATKESKEAASPVSAAAPASNSNSSSSSSSAPAADGASSSASAAPSTPVNAGDLKSSRVYVSNLAFQVSWQDLKDFFRDRVGGEIGRVEVLSYPSGQSKGCAIVELADNDSAAKAINSLTGVELQGRKIFVREDREEAGYSASRGGGAGGAGGGDGGSRGRGRGGFRGRGRGGFRGGPRGGGGGGAGGGERGFSNNNNFNNASAGGSSDEKSVTLYVGNLPWRTTWQDLKDLFNEFGNVLRADVATDRFSGRSKGYGTVKFATDAEAQKAIDTMNNAEYNGRQITVRYDQYAQ